MIQGVGQGLSLVNSFDDRQQLQLDRADANSLRDARLAAQRSELALAPQIGEQNLALAKVRNWAAQNTPIKLANGVTISRQPNGEIVPITNYEVLNYDGTRSMVGEAGVPLKLAEDIQAAKDAATLANRKADIEDVYKQDLAKSGRITAEAAARNAATNELKAQNAAAFDASGGVNNPLRTYNNRLYGHLADLNNYLKLASPQDIIDFQTTDKGRQIAQRVEYELLSKNPGEWPEDEIAYLDKFRADREAARQAAAAQAKIDAANGVRVPASIAAPLVPVVPATTPPVVTPAPTASANRPANFATTAVATLPNGSPVKQVLLPNDQAAYDWALQNPTDTRAAAIRQRLGL
jgi:hypothetical protein